MTEPDGMTEFEQQLSALEESLGSAQSVASSFAGELSQMQRTMADTGRQTTSLTNGIGRSLRGAFDGLLFDGIKLSDALRQVGQSMLSTAYSTAINPVSRQLGRVLGGGLEAAVSSALPFADGAGFAQGRVMPFARGGIVSSPTYFPMRGGTGLMGEAGPEAIMPLARGADGRLGVRAEAGGRPVQVVMNITTPDVEGFRRSQAQVAARVSRALGRGQRIR